MPTLYALVHEAFARLDHYLAVRYEADGALWAHVEVGTMRLEATLTEQTEFLAQHPIVGLDGLRLSVCPHATLPHALHIEATAYIPRGAYHHAIATKACMQARRVPND